MGGNEFFFSLEFSSQGVSARLLTNLASRVLEHVGCGEGTVPGLVEACEKAVANGSAAGGRRCDVQFRAQAGTLEIVVSSNGGRIWQTSHPIP